MKKIIAIVVSVFILCIGYGVVDQVGNSPDYLTVLTIRGIVIILIVLFLSLLFRWAKDSSKE